MMCGSSITWGSKLQTSVVLSNTEAKYMALSTLAQEVIFIRKLLTNLGERPEGPTPTFEDDEGCESLATNAITSAKTKRIDIRCHFVRDLVKSKALEIVWISTSEMIADILIKNTLPTSIHKKHTDIVISGIYSGPTIGLV
jgi:ethanolamine utilization protein EutP (predicted NTPase)